MGRQHCFNLIISMVDYERIRHKLEKEIFPFFNVETKKNLGITVMQLECQAAVDALIIFLLQNGVAKENIQYNMF